MVVILVPVLVLGSFGGTAFLAHAHDGHASHLHGATSIDGARSLARQHRLDHALGVATCSGHHAAFDHHNTSDHHEPGTPSQSNHSSEHPVPAEDPDDVLITIPDHEQLASTGIVLAVAIQTSHLFEAAHWLWTPPDMSDDVGSPGGWCRRGGVPRFDAPLHLSSLSALGRLVRTSGALLL